MKKSVVRLASGLLAVLVMLSSVTWAAADEDGGVNEGDAVVQSEPLGDAGDQPEPLSDAGDQPEPLSDVQADDTGVMPLAGEEAMYTPPSGGDPEQGTFAAMWAKAAAGDGVVTLMTDVTADAETHSFGTGTGFDADAGGAIVVPNNRYITLILNGHTLDRGLTEETKIKNGYVIAVQGGGKLTIADNSTAGEGSITGGYNTAICGGIYVLGTLNVISGTITGNHTAESGGGIFVAITGKLNFSGGKLCNNIAGKLGGGIYAVSSDSKSVNISGGTISGNQAGGDGGGVYPGRNNALRLSGSPQITGNTDTASSSPKTSNVYLDQKFQLSLGTLSGSAKIGISAPLNEIGAKGNIHIVTQDGATEENLNYLFSDDSEKHLAFAAMNPYNRIYLAEGAAPQEHKHALNVGQASSAPATGSVTFENKLTSKNGKLYSNEAEVGIKDIEKTSLNGLYGDTGKVSGYCLPAGAYYLESDIEIDRPIVFSSDSSLSTVNLCLNGHVIKQKTNGQNVICVPLYDTLNICDCHPERTHEGLPAALSQITGGLITGGDVSGVKSDSTVAINCGGGIYVRQELNLYGGTVAGNKAYSGGGIYSDGNLFVYGSTISNNTAATGGGGMYVQSIKYALSNATIDSNTAIFAGGICVSTSSDPVATISNCTISNNRAISGTITYPSGTVASLKGDGGGIYISGRGYSDTSTKLQNCSITNNNALDRGGGIYVGETTNLVGGSITGNTVGTGTDSKGAGICNSSKIYASGAPVIWGNTRDGQENNAYLYNTAAVFAFKADTVLTGDAKIGVTTATDPEENTPVTITDSNASWETYAGCFIADDSEHYHVAYNSTGKNLELRLGKAVTTQHTHNGITFEKLGDTSQPFSSGNYYLATDLNLSSPMVISGGTVNLCLNGHTITGPAGQPAFQVKNGGTLNLYNNEGTGTGVFSGLSGSGGVQVAGGGKLNLYSKDGTTVSNTYSPAAGSGGGTVTVGNDGTVTTPGEGGGEGPGPVDPTPGPGDHKADHPDPDGSFQAINTRNFASVTSANAPAGYTGALPAELSAYRFLNPGKYYLDGNFTMPNALIVLPGANGAAADFCLYGSNLGADNDTWIYEMQHVFWVPEKTTLNVVDCQRDLHIVWLYGGRVFLKNGGKVNISGKLPDYITTIEMTGGEGVVAVEQKGGQPVMSLPKGAALTQKLPEGKTQVITNDSGVLTMTADGKTTKVTPPGTGDSIGLKLPEAVPGGSGAAPAVALEVPAGGTVRTGTDGPRITLEQPGEAAADGTVTSRAVTVTTVDPVTKETVEVTVTAPAGKTVEVGANGAVKAPEGSAVTVGDVTVTVSTIGGNEKTVTVSPDGQVALPAGSQATAGNPKKGSATIVIALPEAGDGGTTGGTLGITETGVKPPQGSNVSAKKDSVTIVIALPYPEGGEEPEIEFGREGTLVLPPDTTVKKGNEPAETVTEDKRVLDPGTGELAEKAPVNPVNPNTPSGATTEITETPVTKGDATVQKKDDGTITVTPANPGGGGEPVVITPLPQEPGAAPVVDETGKVFPNTPFTVEPKDGDGPAITASEDGSVDPDGTVTANTVTVEQPENPGDPSVTLTAPEDDAVKVGPDGGAQVPVGTEVEQDGAKVTIDDVPNPKVPVTVEPDGTVKAPEGSEITVTPKPRQPGQPSQPYTVEVKDVPDPDEPVSVKPDGTLDLPGGSVITVTPKPKPGDPEQTYKVILPDGGGEVKPGPDGKITLPEGTVVIKPDGTIVTVTDPEGVFDLVTGGGSGSGGSGSGGSGGGGSGGGSSGGGSSGGGGSGGSSGGGSGGGSSAASYVIQASAGIGGTIRPRGQTRVAAGASKTFAIVPQTGYDVEEVLVDGVSAGAVTSYTFQNIRRNHTIQASFAVSGSPGLLDTEDHRDYLHGFKDGLFRPDASMTRAQAAQMFYNLLRNRDVQGKSAFTDVPEGMWCYEAVSALKALDIMLGVTEERFEPDRPITRAELVVTAVRFTEHRRGTASFTDVAETDWYYPEISAAAARGWIGGYEDGTFRPNNPITRAQAAAVINRLLGRQADEDFLERRPAGLRSFPDALPGYWAYEDVMEAANAHDYRARSDGERWTALR